MDCDCGESSSCPQGPMGPEICHCCITVTDPNTGEKRKSWISYPCAPQCRIGYPDSNTPDGNIYSNLLAVLKLVDPMGYNLLAGKRKLEDILPIGPEPRPLEPDSSLNPPMKLPSMGGLSPRIYPTIHEDDLPDSIKKNINHFLQFSHPMKEKTVPDILSAGPGPRPVDPDQPVRGTKGLVPRNNPVGPVVKRISLSNSDPDE